MITARIVQPSLPAYRVAAFTALSEDPRFQVSVCHGTQHDLPDAEAGSLDVSTYESRSFQLGSRTLRWISAQFPAASQRRGDVLILEWNLNNLSLVPAMLSARLKGVGTVLWGHGYSMRESLIRRRLRLFVGRRANVMLVYDESTATSLQMNTDSPDRVVVAPNTIDAEPMLLAGQRWSSDVERLDEFRREHDLLGRPVILHVARLIPQRHLNVLVGAMAQLRSLYPRSRLVIIGDGAEEKRRVSDCARAVGVEESVVFVQGLYDEDDLAPWYLSSQIFCSPAHLGLSIFNAFAYALPVVTGDATDEHPPEMRALRHGHNGLLFEHDSESALADALTLLLSDPVLARSLGENGREDMTRSYRLQAMVDGIADAIMVAADI